MEVTKPIIRNVIDTTSSPGYIYFGEAPVESTEDQLVWLISRASLSSPFDINYWRGNISWKLENKLKNKWTDRTSLTY